MTTAIAAAALVLTGALLWLRELRLWRNRAQMDSVVFRYSRRRFIRRTVGCSFLVAVALLAFLGLEVVDFTGRLTLLQVWWAVVGVLCFGLLVIPILDFRETYRHIVREAVPEKLRAEMERVRFEKERK